MFSLLLSVINLILSDMMRLNYFLRSPRLSFYLLSLIFVFVLSACEKDAVPETEIQSADLNFNDNLKKPAGKTNTFYGPAQPLGNGVARAMVTMNHNGEPEAIGVKFSEKVLERLPDEHDILTLRLPNKMQGLAFDHIDLNWNPHGHHPPNIYGAPHFDFHFYMVSEEEKMEITDPLKGEIYPTEEFIPEGYFTPGGLEPQMGVHWLHGAAPELGGADFTHTFIFGSYDGKFIFYEPMITIDFLKWGDTSEFPIPISQPQEFDPMGYYYPTTYSITHDAKKKEYMVTLEGMVWR